MDDTERAYDLIMKWKQGSYHNDAQKYANLQVRITELMEEYRVEVLREARSLITKEILSHGQ